MTLQEIKDLTETILNRHFSGKSISEAEFSLFAQNANLKLFENLIGQLKEASTVGNPFADLVAKSTELRPFKTSDSGAITGGYSLLPSDYKQYLTLLVTIGTSTQKLAEIVTEDELSNFRTSVIVPDLSENPKAAIYQNRMKVIPLNADSFELWYLRNPNPVYYDYCITNGSLQVVYMPVGSQIVQGQGQWDLYDEDGNVLAQDVTHLEYPNQVHESDTVELEWNETIHPRIAYYILLEMGLKLKEELAIQYGMAEISKK